VYVSAQLIFIHGRSQAGKDPATLKYEWLESLDVGLKKTGKSLPIGEDDVRLAYYGDTLEAACTPGRQADIPPVEIRGVRDPAIAETLRYILSKEMLEALADREPSLTNVRLSGERGPLNWEWIQAILAALDTHVPFVSSASIGLFTNDVFQYLTKPSLAHRIDSGVRSAFTDGIPSIVVSHSLGTIVAYRVLSSQLPSGPIRVPLLATLGSPLGLSAIRDHLAKEAPLRCPDGVTRWFNAMDDRDVVALFPLDAARFPIIPAEPSIENYRGVKNRTENRHGISGYLEDGVVAANIHMALVSALATS
jgi:hypothetical protein